MSRKPSDIVTTTVWLTVRERLIVDEMRAMAGLDSDANLGHNILNGGSVLG